MNLYNFLIFIFIFFSIELLYIQFAKKYQIFDIPNYRSSHFEKTIRGGGIIFPIAFFFNLFYSKETYIGFYIGLFTISIICFWDDIKPTKISIRFILQIIAIILIIYQKNDLPIFILIPLGLYSLALMNAFNFMDGINGITVSYGLIIICTLFYINTFEIQFINNEIFILMIAALLVFSFFNFRLKAICFAGDVGSVSLAFILSYLIFLLITKTNIYNYLFFVSVFGIDTFLTILIRIKNKEKLYIAHKSHLFQILKNNARINPLIIAALYSVLQLLVNYIILLSLKYSVLIQCLTLLVILGILILIYMYFRLKYSNKVNIQL